MVAVILENFASLYFTSSDLVSAADLEVFSETWTLFDPDATNYIPIGKLPDLLLQVPRPLGVKGKSRDMATRLCLRLHVPQRNGNVAYREVLKELIENNFFHSDADLDEEAFKALPDHVVPPLSLKLALPPPPPPRSAFGDDDDSNSEGEVAKAMGAQDTIAEAFAMKKMSGDRPKDALIRSLARARTRIAIGDRSTYLRAKARQEKFARRKQELGLDGSEGETLGASGAVCASPEALMPPPKPLPPPSIHYSALELVGVGSGKSEAKIRKVCTPGVRSTPLPGSPPATKLVTYAPPPEPPDPYASSSEWTALELVGFGKLASLDGARKRSPTSSGGSGKFWHGSSSSPARSKSPSSAEKRPLKVRLADLAKDKWKDLALSSDGSVERELDFSNHTTCSLHTECEWTAIELVGMGASPEAKGNGRRRRRGRFVRL